MRKFYLLSTLFVVIIAGNNQLAAQDFSNKGKDFWVGYGYHQVMFGAANGGAQEMVLYFATDQVTNITISIPGVGYTQNLTSPAGNNVLTSATIPKLGAQDARLLTEGLSSKGIHITSDRPMVAYAHIYNASVSGATILFPTNTLGKEYYSVNYKNISNSGNANCFFYVVAADPGTTTVDITPSANTTGGWLAGSTHTVTLTQGQVYNVMGALTSTVNPFSSVDLSGSKIQSVVSASGTCKKIAVFSGSGRISITCSAASSSSDNYMVQDFPKTAWGKKYLTVPAAGNQSFNIFRVCVSDPTTVVKINGAVTGLPLQGGFYYELAQTNLPQLIEADKPVMVAQYFSSQGSCGNGSPGDPEVIYLSAVEQNINKVLWNATPNFAITNHFFNVVIPNTGTAVSSFRLDGAAVPAASFTTHPQDPGYVYLRQSISAGPHVILSDSGFNAIAYGFGSAESYGYNAGTNIKDLFQFITVQNQGGTVNFSATCRGTPFFFSMTFPYEPTQLQWVFGTALNAMGIADVTLTNPLYDSTWIVSGKQLYRYKLPTPYLITTIGTYPIKVIATNPTPDGCGGVQDIDFDVQVFDPPLADFNFATNGCVTNPVQFTDNSNTGTRPVIRRFWNFGDANTSTLNNPAHTYTAPGSYNVKYSVVTDVGCLADTTIHTVAINNSPVAQFAVAAPNCVGKVITFTDQSTVTGSAVINKWTWNFGDASPIVIATTNASQTHTYAAAGTYTATLKVETITGCESTLFSFPITIHENPVSDFSFPNICLPAGAAQFTDLSTIAGGGSIAAWTWDFGDAGTANAQNPLHNYTAVGPWNVTLSVTTDDGCTNAKMKVLNTIYAEPQASFTASPEVCLGNSASFSDNSTAPNSTVTGWNWDFGDAITSTLQNPTHTYTAPGTYTVKLNVTSAIGCQTVNNFVTHTVLVKALPIASIAGNTIVCLNSASPNITFTGAVGTAPYTFTYTINSGSNQTVTTTSGNSVTVPVPTTATGTFTYALVSVQEGSATQCNQPQTGSVTVTVNPLPTATISGANVVCLNSPSPSITFTGAVGTAPYTFTYTINSGPNQTVTTTIGNSATVPVPTNVAGTFTYSLVSVQEGSSNTCSQTQTGSVAITVNPLPTASVAGATEVCLNAPSPNVTFTGAGSTAPYTFTYKINSGPNQTVSTTSGNSVTVAVPTNAAGTFTYSLVSVRDASSTLCSQSQTGSTAVIVNPLPNGNFNFNTPSCETKTITFTDASVANAGTLNGWNWSFGDPASGPLNTSTLQSPTHIFANYGTYTVGLIVTTNKGCTSNLFPRQVTINPQPSPGFTLPEVCLSDAFAQFTDTSKIAAGSVTSWLWNFGDPASGPLNTSTLQNPQHRFNSIGNYTVTLTATSNNGCVSVLPQSFTVNGDIPIANFNALNPATLCANSLVSIQDASTVNFGSVTKVEIYWDNGGASGVFDTDDFPTPGKIYTHQYPNFQAPLTKTFNIRYRAYSGGTCVNDRIKTIVVNAAPKVQFNNMPNVCLDAVPFQITQATETGGVPGTGVFTGPGISSGGIFNPASVGPGTYTITYTYTSATGGCVDASSKTITVYAPPVADFSFPSTLCETKAISFTDNSGTPVGTLASWRWNFGDPASGALNTSNQQNPTHVFANWGNYVVKLNAITSNGCVSTQKVINVTVNPQPKPDFTILSSVCLPNANVTFSNLSSIADGSQSSFNYLWNFGDPGSGTVNTSTGANPSHTFVTTGPFTINLQVTSGAGCVQATNILLNTIHPQPVAAFAVNKSFVCIGDNFTFTDNSNPLDGTTTQWNWTMADGNVKNSNTFSYTYTTPGTYPVSLFIFNSQGCRSTTATNTVTVYPYPGANAGPDKVVLEGGQVLLTPALPAGVSLTYLWTPATWLNNATISSPIASPPDDVTYTLKVTGDGGCSTTDNVFIKVLKAPVIPNIFSPNGDGVHDKWVIAYLESYPGGTVDIFNRYGQLIYHSEGYTQPWDGTVHGEPVPVGTYYYIVNPKNGRKQISGYVDVIR